MDEGLSPARSPSPAPSLTLIVHTLTRSCARQVLISVMSGRSTPGVSAASRGHQGNDTGATRTFLVATDKVWPAYTPLFATLAGAGLRLGEGLGVQWEDIDFAERQIRVQRAMSHGRV